MHGHLTFGLRPRWRAGTLGLLMSLAAAALCAGAAGNGSSGAAPTPIYSWDVAHDVSAPLWQLARDRIAPDADDPADEPDRGPIATDTGYAGDGALQTTLAPPAIPAPLQSFDGLSNQDNFGIFGFRVNPPDPNGEVGPNNYVEMINLVFGVYDKSGNLLLGPVDTGTLWSGFEIPDCTDPSGDPVVMYDQFMDRWVLSQFTTRGPEYFNCVAVSTTTVSGVISTTLEWNSARISPFLIRFSMSGLIQYFTLEWMPGPRCTMVTRAPRRQSSSAAMAAEFLAPTISTSVSKNGCGSW